MPIHWGPPFQKPPFSFYPTSKRANYKTRNRGYGSYRSFGSEEEVKGELITHPFPSSHQPSLATSTSPSGGQRASGADAPCVKRGCSHLSSHLLNCCFEAYPQHPRVEDAFVMCKEHVRSTCNHFGPSLVTSVLPPRAARRPTVTPMGPFWVL